MVIAKAGDAVRCFSPAGPCLHATVVRLNSLTYTVDMGGERRREYHEFVHVDPCQRCTDHPRTYYPRGYEG